MVLRKEEDPVRAKRRPAADRGPDRARTCWECRRQRWEEFADQPTGSACAGHCYDEPDDLSELLHQRRALELGSAQLCLEIHQGPLHLDVDRLMSTAKDEIRSTPAPPADRMLNRRVPPRMRFGENRVHGLHLTAVSEADAIRGIEAEPKLTASRRSECARGGPVNASRSTLGPAHDRLTDTGEARNLHLCQTRDGPRLAQLESEATGEFSRPGTTQSSTSGSPQRHAATMLLDGLPPDYPRAVETPADISATAGWAGSSRRRRRRRSSLYDR